MPRVQLASGIRGKMVLTAETNSLKALWNFSLKSKRTEQIPSRNVNNFRNILGNKDGYVQFQKNYHKSCYWYYPCGSVVAYARTLALFASWLFPSVGKIQSAVCKQTVKCNGMRMKGSQMVPNLKPVFTSLIPEL